MDPESHAFLMLYPLNVLNQVEKFKTKYGLHPFSEITLESLDSLTFVVKTPSVETNDNGKKDSTEISYKDFEHLSGTGVGKFWFLGGLFCLSFTGFFPNWPKDKPD